MSNPAAKAIMPRSEIGLNCRVVPPADVERREFGGPCFMCEARGPCRHRLSHFSESLPESATA